MAIRLPVSPDPVSPTELREFRAQLGASQKSLSRCLGVSTRTVEGWESGAGNPPAAYLRLALQRLALGHSVDSNTDILDRHTADLAISYAKQQGMLVNEEQADQAYGADCCTKQSSAFL